ncbi:MAG: polysaccharide deacetylase family protein [Candidatus Zixiibacteriota bacterium]
MRRLGLWMAFVVWFVPVFVAGEPARKEVAVTIDDLPASNIATFEDQLRINRKILDILDQYHVKATGFVIANRALGKTSILNIWLERGHDLGNHTYSHMDFDQVDAPSFETDIKKGASVIETLLREHERTLKYFRFPYLHTGSGQEKGRDIRLFLEESGYTIAPVTIDTRDWEYNSRFVRAWGANDSTKQARIEAAYLRQVKRVTEQAENVSWERFGRNIRYVLLLHLNRINGEVLDRVLGYYVRSGYSFIPLQEALQDSVYDPDGEFVGYESSSWPVRPELGFPQRRSK